ncbi:hypothetical protein PHMEG_00035164 [Phytophthora megakarya]|uniref:Uncharacterized protein n=1 Tax=Phytophthora megakarya TaxID=4795 RepID=A0A225UQZ8_9STRA|nr:hypothetical protein PHMEG_00035164 [Phytophthora megakarya]
MDTKPWYVMFEDCSKFLILHVRDNLKVIARESLDAIVAFMSVHRRAIWWFGHWVFIDLETDDPYSVELHRERKVECDKAKKEYKKLLDDRVDAGLEETIMDEPGSWTIPAKCCHWILMHESQVKDDGTRYTLNEQMELLDDQEPVKWNCASDEDRIKHLPENYPLKLLKRFTAFIAEEPRHHGLRLIDPSRIILHVACQSISVNIQNTIVIHIFKVHCPSYSSHHIRYFLPVPYPFQHSQSSNESRIQHPEYLHNFSSQIKQNHNQFT